MKEWDLKFLKRISVITGTIVKDYYFLAGLEKENLKDSQMYEFIKDDLDMALQMEKEYYLNLTDCDQIDRMIRYLTQDFGISLENFLYLIFNNEHYNIIRWRILSKLEYILDNSYFEVKEEQEESEEESFIEEETFDEEKITEEDVGILEEEKDKNVYGLYRLQYSIEIDLVNTILRILKDCIDNPAYESIKPNLIEFKHLLSLEFKEVEEEFLKSNFEINDSLTWSSTFIADLYRIHPKVVEAYKNDCCEDLLAENRAALINLLDENHIKEANLSEQVYLSAAVIAGIIIRANLLFVSGEVLDNYLMLIENDIEQTKDRNTLVEKVAKDSINNYEKDKELPAILSLKI